MKRTMPQQKHEKDQDDVDDDEALLGTSWSSQDDDELDGSNLTAPTMIAKRCVVWMQVHAEHASRGHPERPQRLHHLLPLLQVWQNRDDILIVDDKDESMKIPRLLLRHEDYARVHADSYLQR
jgi:hypothetical protein